MSDGDELLDCWLVVPCYRESGRLPGFLPELCSALGKSKRRVRVLLVDDGSGEREQSALRELAAEWPGLVGIRLLDTNRGKGAAIRAGWDAAPDGVELLAFADADGSVSAEGFLGLLERAIGLGGDEVVIASRRLAGSRTSRSWHRRGLSALFYWFVERFYGLGISDTQCGCKIVPRVAYERWEGRLRQERFGFDIELLRLAREDGVGVREEPVVWVERGGSTVTLKAALQLFIDVAMRRY